MGLLSKAEIEEALSNLGKRALEQGTTVELLIVGGAAMVLAYNTRYATHDVDAIILAPRQAAMARNLAQQIAIELGLTEDWLNDGAKGYLVGYSKGQQVFTAPGITAHIPDIPQLLAMKLCAWRDDVDIADAQHLLSLLSGSPETIWQGVQPFLLPGRELKAYYAFLDLWEVTDGND